MNPALPLDGKTILVTGASSGIGAASVKALAQAGARVLLTGRNQTAIQQRLEELPGIGHQGIVHDLLDPTAFQTLWETFEGPLDGMLHAAGTLKPCLAELAKPAEREQTLQLHLFFPQDFLREGLKRKRWNAPASIVWISSLSTTRPAIGYLHYTMAKAALEAACRQWALELAKKQIRINLVRPGLIRTPMSDQTLGMFTEAERNALYQKPPLGAGTPEDIAQAALFLLSETSRWTTGTAMDCDGGTSL